MSLVIKNPEGNVVPFYPIKESGILEAYWMPYKEYNSLEELFCQRDTENRLNKKKKYLYEFIPEHAVVFTCKLTKDDTVNGRKFKVGHKFRIDSNTRAENWRRGGSDAIPKDVLVIEFSYEDFLRMRKCYDTFDSITSVEATAEKFYGLLVGSCGYQPKSNKIKKGTIVTALNYASHYYTPTEYPNPIGIPVESLLGQIYHFLSEIKTIDSIINKGKWPQALLCASIMALKKYGHDNEQLIKGLKNIDAGRSNTEEDYQTGITHIVEEWKARDEESVLGKKGTAAKEMKRQISYCCYWIDKWMIEKKGKKVGGDWENTCVRYKDETVTQLTNLFNNSPCEIK
tara:strand:- start:377 stop:1402 length:1026 start_codon:yes stop_codon:yes gene_type:complete